MDDKKQLGQDGKISGTPAYKRIEQDIRDKIQTGQWTAEMLLPSRPKLAEEYGVARTTLERAIDALILDGTLYAEHGRGTFVAVPLKSQPSSIKIPVTPLSLPQSVYSGINSSFQKKQIKPVLGIITGDMPVSAELTYDPDPSLGFDWTTIILHSLEKIISQEEGTIYFVNRHDAQARERFSLAETIHQLLDQGINAIAIPNVNKVEHITQEVISIVDPKKFPIVLFSWEQLYGPLPYVMYDQAYAGYRAVEHLVEAGYGALFFLDQWTNWWVAERLKGAQAALEHTYGSEKRILRASSFFAVPDPENQIEQKGYLAMKLLLLQKSFSGDLKSAAPPAVIAPKDIICQGILQAAQEAGLQPGIDFGLVGFDNIPAAQRLGLTTLAPPLEEMGQEAAYLLLRMLHKQTTMHQLSLRSHLIVRASTDLARTQRARTSTL